MGDDGLFQQTWPDLAATMTHSAETRSLANAGDWLKFMAQMSAWWQLLIIIHPMRACLI